MINPELLNETLSNHLNLNESDAGHSAVKQKRPAVLCEPWGRGWIWFTHKGVISTKAD